MMLAVLLCAALSVSPVAPAIPVETAARILAEAHLAAQEDGGRLWGRSLDGPLLLVDPETRFAVANQADSMGAQEVQAALEGPVRRYQ
jgi:hypothetical protein